MSTSSEYYQQYYQQYYEQPSASKSDSSSYHGYGGAYGGGYGSSNGGYGDYYSGSSAGGGSNIPYMTGRSDVTPEVDPSSFYVKHEPKRGDPRTKNPKDLPVHSRLFVVHGRDTQEIDLRAAFEDFGEVQDINMLKKKDPDTRQLHSTGVSFIKYGKASHAAKAIEDLHGKAIAGSPKPLKILVAASDHVPGEVPVEVLDDERLRLFIKIPREYSDDKVRDHFKVFGNVEYFNIPKDKCSGEPKGFGYVKYFRFYDAAVALEECDPGFRAIFAEARPPGGPSRVPPSIGHGGHGGYGGHGAAPPPPPPPPPYHHPMSEFHVPRQGQPPQPSASLLMPLPEQYQNPVIRPETTQTVRILCDKSVDERQMSLLCEIIPGFKRCDTTAPGTYEASFSTLGWAQYAQEKLNGFEYPPGARLLVKFGPGGNTANGSASIGSSNGAITSGGGDGGSSGGYGDHDIPFYPCDVQLPPLQAPVPAIQAGSGYAARLFLVCHPCALATHVLTNAFCRFGDLIDVYTLPNKNFGYAKFASVEAANRAKTTLHKATIAGCSIKHQQQHRQEQSIYCAPSLFDEPRTFVATVFIIFCRNIQMNLLRNLVNKTLSIVFV